MNFLILRDVDGLDRLIINERLLYMYTAKHRKCNDDQINNIPHPKNVAIVITMLYTI